MYICTKDNTTREMKEKLKEIVKKGHPCEHKSMYAVTARTQLDDSKREDERAGEEN